MTFIVEHEDRQGDEEISPEEKKIWGRSSSEAGREKSAARRQESSIGDNKLSQVSPGYK